MMSYSNGSVVLAYAFTTVCIELSQGAAYKGVSSGRVLFVLIVLALRTLTRHSCKDVELMWFDWPSLRFGDFEY